MQPPLRFADASFESYDAQDASQAEALAEARGFVGALRKQQRPLQQVQRRLGLKPPLPWQGLYLVGPVGTGKTHLLAAMYHALHPEVPCAFMHASALFRTTQPPQAFARELAEQYRVLCLDEVEIDDPANEARLVLILRTLEARGVLLLATSNVEPERFLNAQFGNDRFRRFLNEEFRRRYKVLFVGGDDYRRHLEKPGRAWIGPSDATRTAMQEAFDQDPRRARWLSFDELMELTTKVEHTRLLRRLTRCESLYLADLAPTGADDAIRLLRLIDDLYLAPDPPELYFTAEAPPETWLQSETLHSSLERGIAEKFARTTSRLAVLCEMEHL